MQSFRQYRKFRSAAESQFARDKARLQGLSQHDRTAVAAGEQSPGSATSDESKADLEKGPSRSESLNVRKTPSGVQQGDLPPEREPTLAADEEQRLAEDQNPEEHEDPASRREPEQHPEPIEEKDFGPPAEDDDDLELSEYAQRTLTRTATQQTTGTALGNVLSGVEVRKRTTTEGGDGNVFVVGYENEDDPNDPHNWSFLVRLRCTIIIALIGIVVGFASAIDSVAIPQASKDFGVSEVAESLATALFLIGFGVGALFAGPISETVGRNPVYIGTLGLYMIFVMASALAPNLGAQLVFRFIAGFFGSTPLTCAGGSISDLWSPLERVYTFPIFANAAFCGPLLGPVVGGFIAEKGSGVSWRWVEWTTLIFSGFVLLLVLLLQPETFPPILLKWKAKHLRDITGDERYKGSIEVREVSFPVRLKRALYRPFLLTAREPIVVLVALYLTVVYIVLFTFLDGYTYIFTDMYGISQGLTGLCFIGIVIGLFSASALVPLIYRWAKRDLQKIKEQGGDRLPPEFRLWYSMLGGAFAVPISLFWMGWTARPDISIWSPLAASVLFGYGILCIFITCYQYIIDAYETYAASALASITLIRYIASGGMVVVGIPFYENLGVAYTLTIMACISSLMVPVPYVFFKYGHWIRSKSKYAINPE